MQHVPGDQLPEWAYETHIISPPPPGWEDRKVVWYQGESAWKPGENPHGIMSQLLHEHTEDPDLRQRFIDLGLWDSEGKLTDKGRLHLHCFE